MSDYFPQEVVLEILLKLPVKTLVKFTCVCKNWNSIIKSPCFISTHLSKATFAQNSRLLLISFLERSKQQKFSLYFDDSEFSRYMQLNFPSYNSNSRLKVVGSCKGLVCLADESSLRVKNLIVWNPSVRKWLRLPQPSILCPVVSGFGFDFRTNDFKLLRFVNPETLVKRQEGSIDVELYSLNANSWRNIAGLASNYKIRCAKAVFLSEFLYWLVFKRGTNGQYSNLILGFDLNEEVFKETMLPESLEKEDSSLMVLREHSESSLALIHHKNESNRLQILVFKKDAMLSSWTKFWSIDVALPLSSFALELRKNGAELLGMTRRALFSYDLGSQKIRFIEVQGRVDSYEVSGYMESLLLLDR